MTNSASSRDRRVSGTQCRRMLRSTVRMLGSTVMLAFLCSFSIAQQTSAPQQQPSEPISSPPPETAQPKTKSEQEKELQRKEQSQRALGVLPLFGVTSRQNASPLTGREKFNLFVRSAFDPATISIVGVQAAISQGQNEFPAYGQGAAGYGKRFGASFADSVSSNFFSNYFWPVLLKQDPRYFRLGEGSIKRRIFYGVKQEFVCRTDKGGRAFNYSNVLGAFTSGAVSNLYYPGNTLIRTIPSTPTSPPVPVYENDRGVVLTISRTAIALGYGTIGGLFDEFWPDVQHRFFRRHSSDRAASNQ